MAEFMTAWGWVLAIALQLLMGWVIWSLKSAFASKKELQAMELQIDELRLKIVEVEGRMRNMPAAEAMHELSNSIERLRGDLKTLGARLDGTKDLVERVERVVARHEQIFTQAAQR